MHLLKIKSHLNKNTSVARPVIKYTINLKKKLKILKLYKNQIIFLPSLNKGKKNTKYKSLYNVNNFRSCKRSKNGYTILKKKPYRKLKKKYKYYYNLNIKKMNSLKKERDIIYYWIYNKLIKNIIKYFIQVYIYYNFILKYLNYQPKVLLKLLMNILRSNKYLKKDLFLFNIGKKVLINKLVKFQFKPLISRYIYKNIKKKWIKRHLKLLLLKHLKYKIASTLSTYYNKEILVCYIIQRKRHLKFDNVKQISDILKFILQTQKKQLFTLYKFFKLHRKELRKNKKFFYRFKNRIKIKRRELFNKHILNCFLSLLNIKLNNIEYFLSLKKCKRLPKKLIKKSRKSNLFFSRLFRNRLVKKKIKKKIKFLREKELKTLLTINTVKNPLIGIRIELNGTEKKGRRARRTNYMDIAAIYCGRMPHKNARINTQYLQTYARTKRSSIGIKLWVYLKTPVASLLNLNKQVDLTDFHNK